MSKVVNFTPSRFVGSDKEFRAWKDASEAAAEAPALDDADILHLAELVPVVRRRLTIGPDFSDDAILASLKRVVAKTTDRDRWGAAFDSNLALWLSAQGRELGSALTTLVALMPPPRL